MKQVIEKTILFFIILFASCTLVVDVDIPIQEAKLIVNSLFTPDSVWQVEITDSRNILDDTHFIVREVDEIVIFDEFENIVATLSSNGFGVYRSDKKPEHGKTYSVRIKSEGKKVLTARGIIPESISISSVKIDTVLVNHEYGTTQNLVLEVKFKDPAEEVNYYRFDLIVKQAYEYYNPQTQELVKDTSRWVYFLQVDTPSLLEDNYSHSIISDAKFNGREVSIRFKPIHGLLGGNTKLDFISRNFSEEYYKYSTTLELQNNTREDPFAQPVKVFSNINNGLGIFAGYSSTFHSINK